KRKHASVRERAGVMERRAVGALDEFVAESALSGSRLRRHEGDGGTTRLRLAQRLVEKRELPLAADEAREATRLRALEAVLDPARAPYLEHGHGNAGALEPLLATVEEVEEARREARRLLRRRDTARRRQLLHPGGEPDHVPLRGIVHAQVVA